MKKLLIALFLLISFSAFAQTKKTKILEEKIGAINLSYSKNVDLDKNETHYFCSLIFQNAKYTSISDIKAISFVDKNELEAFTKDLNKIYEQILLDEKVDFSFKRTEYSLVLYDFSPNLYLNSFKGVTGYTILGKPLVKKLIDNLSKIDFGSDTLK